MNLILLLFWLVVACLLIYTRPAWIVALWEGLVWAMDETYVLIWKAITWPFRKLYRYLFR